MRVRRERRGRRGTSRRAELGFAEPSRAGTATLAIAALVVLGAVVYSTVQSNGSGGHGSHSAPPSPTVADEGLADVHDGYRLELLDEPAARGQSVPVAFRIFGPDSRPVTEYDLDHTKLLHFYVLRDDLSHYQHLHPTLSGDTWNTTIAVPDGGQYRLYAEFLAKGRPNPTHPTILGAPFTVPGDTTFVPLPAPAATVNIDNVTVSRPEGAADIRVGKINELRFQVCDSAGRPIDHLDTYLGAYAHLSAFNALTMGLLHQHPLAADTPGGPELTFSAQFAARGEHRLFLEFIVNAQLHRAEFTVFVT